MKSKIENNITIIQITKSTYKNIKDKEKWILVNKKRIQIIKIKRRIKTKINQLEST